MWVEDHGESFPWTSPSNRSFPVTCHLLIFYLVFNSFSSSFPFYLLDLSLFLLSHSILINSSFLYFIPSLTAGEEKLELGFVERNAKTLLSAIPSLFIFSRVCSCFLCLAGRWCCPLWVAVRNTHIRLPFTSPRPHHLPLPRFMSLLVLLLWCCITDIRSTEHTHTIPQRAPVFTCLMYSVCIKNNCIWPEIKEVTEAWRNPDSEELNNYCCGVKIQENTRQAMCV